MRQLLFQLRTSAGADHSLKLLSLYFASTAITCQNEEQPKASRESDASNYKNLTLGQKIFHQIFRKDLPTPRLMTPSDPIFQSSQMKRCVKERKADEKRLEGSTEDCVLYALNSLNQAGNSRDLDQHERYRMYQAGAGHDQRPDKS